jgi:hypothetical protein
VLPGERRSEYVAFRNLLLDSPGIEAAIVAGTILADQYVHAKWRIRGLGAAEAMTPRRDRRRPRRVWRRCARADFFNLMEQREKYLSR